MNNTKFYILTKKSTSKLDQIEMGGPISIWGHGKSGSPTQKFWDNKKKQLNWDIPPFFKSVTNGEQLLFLRAAIKSLLRNRLVSQKLFFPLYRI